MRGFLIIAMLILGFGPVHDADAAENWIRAENQDCTLWHPDPDDAQKVRWFGACRDGRAHGKGVAEWYAYQRPPDRCNCTFVDGRVEGEGTLRWADGVIYIGEFKAGIYEGDGYIRYPDNESYEGEFRRGLPNGWGMQILPDNTRIMGKFVDGVHIKVD